MTTLEARADAYDDAFGRTALATPIPFLDLRAMTAGLRPALDLAIDAVLRHGQFVGGPEVTQFEHDFALLCGARHCVGVANGTDALTLVLEGLGIGRGDEVIVPTNTFVATAEAVQACGATPVFVDVDPDTLLIDPAAVEDAIGTATAAVIVVHLFGQPADCGALRRITRRHGLALIEDAAQAHGAREGGRTVGSLADAAAFSFYPGKNLGALGDGGAVVTSDEALAARIRSLADHGRCPTDRHQHRVPGRNSRLDTVQAAALGVKLRHLAADNARRAVAMQHYRDLLPPSVRPVATRPGVTPAYHLAVVQTEHRERLCAALTQHQIGWGVHYPIPCHQQGAFATGERLPVAERAARRILSLPLSPLLSADQISRVCAVVESVVNP